MRDPADEWFPAVLVYPRVISSWTIVLDIPESCNTMLAIFLDCNVSPLGVMQQGGRCIPEMVEKEALGLSNGQPLIGGNPSGSVWLTSFSKNGPAAAREAPTYLRRPVNKHCSNGSPGKDVPICKRQPRLILPRKVCIRSQGPFGIIPNNNSSTCREIRQGKSAGDEGEKRK